MIFVHGNDGYGSSIWEGKHKQVQGEKNIHRAFSNTENTE